MAIRRIEVLAFVDWTAQIYNAGATKIQNPMRRAQATLDRTCRALAVCLTETEPHVLFNVRLRLYHGWYRGLTRTENRDAMRTLESSADFEFPRFDHVVFWRPIEYSENLINALPHRKRQKPPQIELPDTCRPAADSHGDEREKMVDTALACDLVTHARFDPADWRVILAEDDDFVPAAFVAEAWSKGKGGRTLLLRRRQQSKHLELTGILKEDTT
ncbi:hypothetical protein [uncultured Lamprocystis sp.]|jgi:hypothetical protein|uniref:hypothetical protein n=1 Tax=uncultured Lamprocystis sp. TaxID=543132 RepID=UPI0025F04E3D|nr:hypothetical protein [uncultured Lamprocystis sp.]